jgi:membrane protease YdiL (CAAX protease family)
MTVIQNICFASLVYILYVHRGMFSLKEMGFHTANLNKSIVIGLIVGGMLFLVSALVFPSVNHALDPNGKGNANDPITQGLTTPANIAVIFVLVSVVAPLGEEFFFRGLVFRGSKFFFDSGNWGKDLPLILAMCFSGILFAVVHFYGIAGTLLIFGLGMVLAYVCHHTDSLVTSMLVHALYNAGVIVGVLAFG